MESILTEMSCTEIGVAEKDASLLTESPSVRFLYKTFLNIFGILFAGMIARSISNDRVRLSAVIIVGLVVNWTRGRLVKTSSGRQA